MMTDNVNDVNENAQNPENDAGKRHSRHASLSARAADPRALRHHRPARRGAGESGLVSLGWNEHRRVHRS